MTFLLPTAAVEALCGEVGRWGADDVETGGFLLGSEHKVKVVAWPGGDDVFRYRMQFAVDGLALARLFEWADAHDLVVYALVHSHRGRAFLSPTDLRHGFSVPGFISGVVPFYDKPSTEVGKWSWWRYERSWVDIDAPETIDGPCAQITFDRNGVRE